MLKLNLLDNNEGIDIDYVISSLQANTERTNKWKEWLHDNAELFNIADSAVYTAREDRNMLSISIGIVETFNLGEKEVRDFLSPLLDKLHEDGLL
jgi:ubiquitin C-terminal hydrolase